MGSRPKTVIFWPFLAFEGRFGGLKDLLEVRVEVKTCRTIHGTHLEGILSQKIGPGWQAGSETVKTGQNLTFGPSHGKYKGLIKHRRSWKLE